MGDSFTKSWKKFKTLNEAAMPAHVQQIKKLFTAKALQRNWNSRDAVPSIRAIIKTFCKNKNILAAMDAMDDSDIGSWIHHVKDTHRKGLRGSYQWPRGVSDTFKDGDSSRKKITLKWHELGVRAYKILAPYIEEYYSLINTPSGTSRQTIKEMFAARLAFVRWIEFLANVTISTTVVHELAHAYDPDINQFGTPREVGRGSVTDIASDLSADEKKRAEVYATNQTKRYILNIQRSQLFKELFSRTSYSAKDAPLRRRVRKRAGVMDVSSFSVGAWLHPSSIKAPTSTKFIDSIYAYSHSYGDREENRLCKSWAHEEQWVQRGGKLHLVRGKQLYLNRSGKQRTRDKIPDEEWASGLWRPFCYTRDDDIKRSGRRERFIDKVDGEKEIKHSGLGLSAHGDMIGDPDERGQAWSRETLEDEYCEENPNAEECREKSKKAQEPAIVRPKKRKSLKEGKITISIIKPKNL